MPTSNDPVIQQEPIKSFRNFYSQLLFNKFRAWNARFALGSTLNEKSVVMHLHEKPHFMDAQLKDRDRNKKEDKKYLAQYLNYNSCPQMK